jgi:hypothetical protein
VLLNSRDHADPFGAPHDRLVVGGTISELGIGTIGIAQSIDPGNFATSETGVVLLDLLSGPAFDPNSLNSSGSRAPRPRSTWLPPGWATSPRTRPGTSSPTSTPTSSTRRRTSWIRAETSRAPWALAVT